MVRMHPRDVELQGVEPKIHLQLMRMEDEYNLTDCEMIEILHNYTSRKVSHFIKHEREGDLK